MKNYTLLPCRFLALNLVFLISSLFIQPNGICQAILGEAISVNGIGIQGASQKGTGMYGVSELGDGVYGTSQEGSGVRGYSTSLYGVLGESSGAIGVVGSSNSNIGVSGLSTSSYGVYGGSASNHGAFFRGNKNNGFADIILGASSGSSAGDNGIIRSDPNYSGSDIYLEGNDAVVARIDYNNNGTGNFFVTGQNGATLFRVYHDGTVSAASGFVQNSDRSGKERIEDLSYSDILKAVSQMPIYEWQYKGQDRRHIGPIAQDFHEAFGLGDDNKSISALDADGIALAAIKAQQEIIEELKEEINQLKQDMREMSKLVQMEGPEIPADSQANEKSKYE